MRVQFIVRVIGPLKIQQPGVKIVFVTFRKCDVRFDDEFFIQADIASSLVVFLRAVLVDDVTDYRNQLLVFRFIFAYDPSCFSGPSNYFAAVFDKHFGVFRQAQLSSLFDGKVGYDDPWGCFRQFIGFGKCRHFMHIAAVESRFDCCA